MYSINVTGLVKREFSSLPAALFTVSSIRFFAVKRPQSVVGKQNPELQKDFYVCGEVEARI